MKVHFYNEIERDCIGAGLPQRKFAYDNRTSYDARANIMRMHRKVHFLSSKIAFAVVELSMCMNSESWEQLRRTKSIESHRCDNETI